MLILSVLLWIYLYFIVLLECSLLLYLSIYLYSCVVYIRWFISKIQTPEWVTFTEYKNRFYCLFKGFILSVGINYLIWGLRMYVFHFYVTLKSFIELIFLSLWQLFSFKLTFWLTLYSTNFWAVGCSQYKIHRDQFLFSYMITDCILPKHFSFKLI